METFKAIVQRRAIKQYDPRHRLTEEEIDQLLSLAMLAPTAFNIQNWRFVLVRDPELRQQIRAVSWDQAQVTDASLFIVLCADLQAWNKDPERYWRDAPEAIRDFMVPAIDSYLSRQGSGPAGRGHAFLRHGCPDSDARCQEHGL